MCGIVGVFGLRDVDRTFLARMSDAIKYRGPDDSGFWLDSNASIGLAHRRLSILDLSTAGHQPMISASGRYVIVFNGEIYNHLLLRQELINASLKNTLVWRGQSDTETLLAAIEFWGLKESLIKCSGMFSLALWDRQKKVLFLARDRMGEKPLYYGWQGSGLSRSFLFGSELKALKASPSFASRIDRGSLALFLRHNYVPTPYSIYEGIYKLEQGSILSLSLDRPNPVIDRYWNLIDVAQNARANAFHGSPTEAIDTLGLLMSNAVKQQMISDVPLGAFLSGGIDSSLIVSLMQSQSMTPVQTFTIGFEDSNYDEAVYAKAVAKHLGTEHHELYISSREALNVIPFLPSLFCEPFADSSQIPTYLVSQLAKKYVTVCLTGDGGDELFAGYNRYDLSSRLWKNISPIPYGVRTLISKALTLVSPEHWDYLASIVPTKRSYFAFGDKIHKGASLLNSANLQELYRGMVSQVQHPESWVINSTEHITKLNTDLNGLIGFSDIEKMMILDSITYLPDDILVKIDRAAMSTSLEGRVPFLDHRVVDFSHTLPFSYKLKDGKTKWLLRELLYRYIPREIVERPKMGFGVPMGAWLRGPLKDWAEELISERRLIDDGYFDAKIIREKWGEHLSGRRNWQSQLWTVLMFQSWLHNER